MNAPGHPVAGKLLTCLTILLILMLAGCQGPAERKAHHMALGRQYLTQQKYAKAGVEFRNALQITPNDIEARYLSAFVFERLGNLTEAVGAYQSVLNVKSDYLPALARMGRLVLLYAGP